MYKKYKIGVVVPAYNEELLINDTIKGIPRYVDKIIAVDDASTDLTYKKLQDLKKVKYRLEIIHHKQNRGVGGSIINGYHSLIKQNMEIVVVMAGDNQMDPKYLPSLLDKLIEDGFDVAKGNRFIHPQELETMPKFRFISSIIATFITKIASGYWTIFDVMNGYVASKTSVLKLLNFHKVKKGYDFEISMLINLNILGAKITDVPIPAVYSNETSNIKVWKVLPSFLWTLFQGFWQRIFYKYIFFNTHPIAIFFIFGLLLMFIGTIIGFWVTIATNWHPTASSVLLAVLPIILGFQLFLTAVIIDIQNEPK